MTQQGWDIGIRTLRNYVLSIEMKVYKLEKNSLHVEIRWKNNKSVKHPSYGAIQVTG